MSIQKKNQDVVRQYIEQLWNKRDIGAIERYIGPDIIGHGTPTVQGISSMYAMAEGTLSAMPDLFFDIHDLFGEADRVVVRYTMGGTLQESWGGLPATNSTVALEGMIIFRLVDELIKEAWVITDSLSMMQEAGIITAPEAA